MEKLKYIVLEQLINEGRLEDMIKKYDNYDWQHYFSQNPNVKMSDVIENSIGLKMRGKYTDAQFLTIYTNYMKKHYMCTNCKNYKCYLIKIKKNIHKLCTFCNKVVV